MKLCDVTNEARFAKHIICAVLYEHEIKVLLVQMDRTAKGTLPSLGRHSAALKSIVTYREAFDTLMATDNWCSVASFFAPAFEHRSIEAGPSYKLHLYSGHGGSPFTGRHTPTDAYGRNHFLRQPSRMGWRHQGVMKFNGSKRI